MTLITKCCFVNLCQFWSLPILHNTNALVAGQSSSCVSCLHIPLGVLVGLVLVVPYLLVAKSQHIGNNGAFRPSPFYHTAWRPSLSVYTFLQYMYFNILYCVDLVIQCITCTQRIHALYLSFIISRKNM